MHTFVRNVLKGAVRNDSTGRKKYTVDCCEIGRDFNVINEKTVEYYETVIEALEKADIKKPIYAAFPLFFWCPCCGSAIKKRIEHSTRIINNCPFCGQGLDWSDT